MPLLPKINLRVVVLFFLLLGLGWGWAQVQKAKLEKKMKASLWQVKKNQRLLSDIRNKKNSNLNALNLIKAQIRNQEKLIQAIQEEIQLLDDQIADLKEEILAYQDDLDQLKSEYAHMIYVTSKSTNSLNQLNYLFASSSFNQLYRRVKYLQHYSQARTQQAGKIKELAQRLNQDKEKIEVVRNEKEALLKEKIGENENLETLKKEKLRVLNSLSSQEEKLRKQLQKSKRNLNNLEKLLADLRQGSGRPRKGKKNAAFPVSNAPLTKNFAKSKGKLNWPITRGVVTSRFGKQDHPVLKGVKIDNAGIDIQALPNTTVKSVFNGTVSTVAKIPGMGGEVVMIQHGDYFTVYARVKEVKVKAGDVVKANSPIAKVHSNGEGNSLLQFQVWKKSKKLNPESWLIRKK